MPLSQENLASSTPSAGSITYSYSSSVSESTVPVMSSFSVSHGSGSWSSFPTSVSSVSASLQPYISSGPEPSFTVIVESFTIPLPQTSDQSESVSSSIVLPPTLTTVVATATVPLNTSSATIVHTFTVTESALHSSRVSPFPSVSISEETSYSSAASSAASKTLKSAASQESVLRSIFSQMGSSNSGTGPNLPHAKASTKPGAIEVPLSMITATFTLVVPTTTSVPLVPFFPTHSGPMVTDPFTITLPPPPKTTSGVTETVTTCTSSTVSWSSETPCTSSTTTSSCEETPASTSSDDGLRTYTLTTEVTISLGNGPKTTSCANETATIVPSGSDAITVTYTLPGGPGRASQTVTITTVRPQPTITSGGSSSFLASASSSGIWSVGNSTTAGPTGTGTVSARPTSSGFSWSVSGNLTTFHSTAPGTGKAPSSSSTDHVLPSPGIVVITETKTLTQMHTTTPNAAPTGQSVQPHANMTTVAGTGAAAPTGSGPHPHANATGSHGHGIASPTHGAHVFRNFRREAECGRGVNGGRVVLDFDNVTIQMDKGRSAPTTQGFANPDQGIQFSGGFQRVVCSTSSLFVPSSPPAMLRYNQNAGGTAKIGSADGCSRFNLVSWNLGCGSTDAPCRFNITGFRRVGGQDVASGSKVVEISQANKVSDNTLELVVFGTSEFSNLSSFTVQLEVNNSGAVSWWSDDLSVAPVCTGAALCTELRARNTVDMAADRVAEKAAPFWHRVGRVEYREY
ncbi:hypothetical protein SBRCBS47491_007536 [Sporothrix bragantina]|uniref:DUF7371 domain-containing protein n=1 Tax=Sporothrix bragantina TaxID=671064 RepID=A0ABP0CDZ5_9PEZI